MTDAIERTTDSEGTELTNVYRKITARRIQMQYLFFFPLMSTFFWKKRKINKILHPNKKIK